MEEMNFVLGWMNLVALVIIALNTGVILKCLKEIRDLLNDREGD